LQSETERGIVHSIGTTIWRTIPDGTDDVSPECRAILPAKAEDRHARPVEAGAGKHGHHDRVSPTQGVGIPDELFPSRKVLHVGGDPGIRCVGTLVVPFGMVFPTGELALDVPALCGASGSGPDGGRVGDSVARASPTAVVPSLPAATSASARKGGQVCLFGLRERPEEKPTLASPAASGGAGDGEFSLARRSVPGTPSGLDLVLQSAGRETTAAVCRIGIVQTGTWRR